MTLRASYSVINSKGTKLMSKDPGQPRRRCLLQLGGGLLLIGIGACDLTIPGQGPPPLLYRLTPKSTFDDTLPTVDWQLLVEAPLVQAGLNTTRIALQRSPTQFEYYARANWTDRAPDMVQTLVLESFENSGSIVAVGRDSVGLRADFVLKIELREFQAEYGTTGPPDIRVQINAKLVRMPRRAIVASERFESVDRAPADRLEPIVNAFDDALGTVLRDLVEWTLRTGETVFSTN